MTTWLPIPEFPNYEVSDDGQVRSVSRTIIDRNGKARKFTGRVLRLQDYTGRGYMYAPLCIDGKLTPQKRSRLMLMAFVGPPPYPGAHARHLNDVQTDDRLENLAWGSAADNGDDAVRNGKHHNAAKTECPQGHPYTEQNTRIYRGARFCRQCSRERSAGGN